jgi:ferredoxin-NADP reductase/predicted pyridoxine 5'-phosphate oxidase superfamily flavin-nucleotide-binding protein
MDAIAKLDTWHDGEKFIQEKVGVADRMKIVGKRVIRDYLPAEHREFYAQIPFIVLGSVDDEGDAWATLLAGKPGFMSSPSPKSLDIDVHRDPDDPAEAGLRRGDALGLLGIELHTRRRNRVNGIIGASASTALRLEVEQSFGNCPQYIQLRDFTFARNPGTPFEGEVFEGTTLDDTARVMIEKADTFFVASYAEREGHRQVDVSHRGGKTGFVRIDENGTLTIPDFAGNLFFATLGNILLNGKAGLVFIDFETGDLLQLTGDAEVVLDSPEIAAFQGAERLLTFKPRRIVRRPEALPLHWSFEKNGWSPNALMTGDWKQTADRLRASTLATQWRPFKVTNIVDESSSIRSFHLQPNDGAGLVPHQAGQHLPIRLSIPGRDKSVIRTYTLSVAPSDGLYRISVKKDGVASAYLHDHILVGDLIEARAPAGNFTIDPFEKRPAVLIGAGVGMTPMIAMLRNIVYEGFRTRNIRPTVVFQAAHSRKDRPFADELARLAYAAQGAVKVIRVLSDVTDAKDGADYEIAGHIDLHVLTEFLSLNDYDFYLCGPPAFTQSLYEGLLSFNIPDNRIHAESFGPSSLVRIRPQGEAAAKVPPATGAVPVTFTTSLKEAPWTPESGTLLELAESRGLSPPFSCREGTCGTCRTKLDNGAVSYIRQPTATVADNEVLICCAVPAKQEKDQENRIELAL